MGLPLRTDGKPGERARRALELGRLVQELTGVGVVSWDERLSTRAAQRSLAEAGVRGKKGRQAVDQAAATLILQSYLDAIKERGPASGSCESDKDCNPPRSR